MGEYIEREALRKRLREHCVKCDARYEDRLCLQCVIRNAWEIINETPAADVVEV